MKKEKESIDVKIILAFAAIYIIWGSTYLAIKIGLEDIPPFLMASMRYFIAGVLMIAIHLIRQGGESKGNLFRNMVLGAFLLTFGQGVIFWAEQYLSSGLTAVFIATLPIWYIVADRRNWKGYFSSKLTLVSIALGLAGIVVLFSGQTITNGQEFGNKTIIASFVAIGSCICWAVGSLYYKYNLSGGPLFYDVGYQLIGGALSCLTISLFLNEGAAFNLGDVTTNAWGALLYLSIAGSIIAFTASYYLLARRPAAVVGTYAYVNPIIAVLLGFFIAGETITARQIIAMGIILLAAYLANKVKLEKV
ncbi:EamA family transporter [Dyadobacter arcticus]|uniref:Drug/metabolite transporter (DMT)-like permease n=1 Tax=Dyadobacter arcticus TaxID=1078754 RepID=A0ABX0UUY9_9BACT|nr:EamA family transporter [Dyadobacter arcticus]NIJ54741.1 drug/metabolite transporter (DMT)-like permease [Dyadobacter arcticus]